MANNTVQTQYADAYVGDDQTIKITPDVTDDDSGIPLASWQVVVTFARGAITNRQSPSLPPIYMLTLSYDSVDSFSATLAAAILATFQPGQWIMQFWRINNGARKLLLNVELTVWGTVKPTTTSSTSTTTTTT